MRNRRVVWEGERGSWGGVSLLGCWVRGKTRNMNIGNILLRKPLVLSEIASHAREGRNLSNKN